MSTPNYDLALPDEDDLVSVPLLNENFTKIDTAIKDVDDKVLTYAAVLVGTFDDFPPGTIAGQVGVAVDQGYRLFTWSGSAWETTTATASTSNERNKYGEDQTALGVGDYVGQLGVTWVDRKVYYWDGGTWEECVADFVPFPDDVNWTPVTLAVSASWHANSWLEVCQINRVVYYRGLLQRDSWTGGTTYLVTNALPDFARLTSAVLNVVPAPLFYQFSGTAAEYRILAEVGASAGSISAIRASTGAGAVIINANHPSRNAF